MKTREDYENEILSKGRWLLYSVAIVGLMAAAAYLGGVERLGGDFFR